MTVDYLPGQVVRIDGTASTVLAVCAKTHEALAWTGHHGRVGILAPYVPHRRASFVDWFHPRDMNPEPDPTGSPERVLHERTIALHGACASIGSADPDLGQSDDPDPHRGQSLVVEAAILVEAARHQISAQALGYLYQRWVRNGGFTAETVRALDRPEQHHAQRAALIGRDAANRARSATSGRLVVARSW